MMCVEGGNVQNAALLFLFNKKTETILGFLES